MGKLLQFNCITGGPVSLAKSLFEFINIMAIVQYCIMILQ